MHSYSYLNTANAIIQSYDGNIPLALWLKQFFRSNKKFGSKDRKTISHACYCFYRLGNSFQNLNIEERILAALFLCSNSSNKILEELKPEWNDNVLLPIDKKITILSAQDELKRIFPFPDEITTEIDQELFNLSFLIQPDLYLRIRPGKTEKVIKQLQDESIDFNLLGDDCVQLSNQSKIDGILNVDEDVVIQDFNSQKTLELLNASVAGSRLPFAVWDCCAASGGKSILFHDHFPNVHLTVSDVRETILLNLKNRFKKTGIKNYQYFAADISSSKFSIKKKFDFIICDAPCSGSGTWSRTPEQLNFFKKERIDYYANLQKKIVSNASNALKKDGHFLYITCSVFGKENEDVVEFIQNNLPLELESMQYLKGCDKKADTLFVALFSGL